MAYSLTPLDAFDQFEATGAETRTFARFSMPERGVCLCRAELLCVRTSDSVAKTITADLMIRRLSGGSSTLIEVFPVGTNILATSGDETTLTGATVSFFASADEAGLTVTTPAGMTLAWSVRFLGRILTSS